MKNNCALDEGRREFKNENYEKSVQIFLQEVLRGTPKALQYAGKGMLYTRVETRNDLISKVNCVRITNYLKSELMKKKNAQAFIDLVITYRRSGYPISNKLKYHYYLKLAQESLTPEEGESRNEAMENERESVNGITPAIVFKENLNKLDYFWSMVEPFWIEQYKLNPETKAILESCQSEATRERFNSNVFPFYFEKKHFKCKSQPVYLIYAEGEFNQPEIARLVANTMSFYGSEITVCEWKSINSIPRDSIVAVLGDGAFFAESHKPEEKQHPAYRLIHQHGGIKLWIPWQIPAEISEPDYWSRLAYEWKYWTPLETSLLEEPLETLIFISEFMRNSQQIYPVNTEKTEFYHKKINFSHYMKGIMHGFGISIFLSLIVLIVLTTCSLLSCGSPYAALIALEVVTLIWISVFCFLKDSGEKILKLTEDQLETVENDSVSSFFWRKINHESEENNSFAPQ